MSFAPRLLNGRPDPAHPGAVQLGDPLLDAYLDLVGARARPNTLIATASALHSKCAGYFRRWVVHHAPGRSHKFLASAWF
jgi:hypothetical protein